MLDVGSKPCSQRPSRVALYDPEPARLSSTDSGVCKTMGVARCSATGLYTYYAADGHRLKEHPDCPGLFYCEEWYDDFSSMAGGLLRTALDRR